MQKLLKVACFLDECLSLLELLFEAIPSANLIQEALQKSEFVVKVEKLICQTHEVMNEIRRVLDLRTKTFSHSNTGTESISHSSHKQALKIFLPSLVTENIVTWISYKTGYLIKLFWCKQLRFTF